MLQYRDEQQGREEKLQQFPLIRNEIFCNDQQEGKPEELPALARTVGGDLQRQHETEQAEENNMPEGEERPRSAAAGEADDESIQHQKQIEQEHQDFIGWTEPLPELSAETVKENEVDQQKQILRRNVHGRGQRQGHQGAAPSQQVAPQRFRQRVKVLQRTNEGVQPSGQ
ncbi:MAG: hypothetical protein Q9P14_00265 [candidate division KSB1 bacterium]|nr:hypothetical protein [candidate division KSB1 bacterium]